MSSQVYNRVANWNSQRYDRVYDHNLTLSLLKEEFQEWSDSCTAVDALDGLCDIIYVAYGALWKLNLSDNAMQIVMHEGIISVQQYADNYSIPPGYGVASTLLCYAKTEEYQLLSEIIALAFCQMYYMGLNGDDAIEALNIVCDSNDSKSVKKTTADKKANDGDKGADFIAPEPRLQALLDRVQARDNAS